jgi:hypothetical protein
MILNGAMRDIKHRAQTLITFRDVIILKSGKINLIFY